MQKGTVIENGVLHRDFGDACIDGAKPCDGFSPQNHKNAYPNPARNSEKENGHCDIASFSDERRDNEGNRHERLQHPTSNLGVADADANPERVSLHSSPGHCDPSRSEEGCLDDVTATSKDRTQTYISYAKPETDPCSSIRSIGGVRPKRIGTFLTRMLTAMLAAVMTVSLGTFASDMAGEGGVFGSGEQSAYAATGTTPYTNIDVPLTSNNGSDDGSNPNAAASNSDNASANRVGADGDGQNLDALGAGILGPTLPSVSGRTSGNTDAESSDGDTYIEGPYAYERIKDDNGEDTGKVTLVKVDPTVGKVARIEANVAEIAAGAFAECEDLKTLIVFGNVKSIAKSVHSVDGNITQEGAFTDEQLKSVHVVFATTYLDETSLHETHPVGPNADSNESGSADEGAGDDDEGPGDADGRAGAGNGDNAANAAGASSVNGDIAANATDGNGEAADGDIGEAAVGGSEDERGGAGASTTPVEEGVKRLSGDVMLSAPSIKDDADNVWLQMGFENIVDTPQIGANGTAIENGVGSNSDMVQGKDGNAIDDSAVDQNGGQPDGDASLEDASSKNPNDVNAESDSGNDQGKRMIDLTSLSESDNEMLSQFGISVSSSTSDSGTGSDANAEAGTDEGIGADADGFTYTLLPDYTLEVAWNGDGDMPVDLALPEYGQVDGTIYIINRTQQKHKTSRSFYSDADYSVREAYSTDTAINIRVDKSYFPDGYERLDDYWRENKIPTTPDFYMSSSDDGYYDFTFHTWSTKYNEQQYLIINMDSGELYGGKYSRILNITACFDPHSGNVAGAIYDNYVSYIFKCTSQGLEEPIRDYNPKNFGILNDLTLEEHWSTAGYAENNKPSNRRYWVLGSAPLDVAITFNANGGSVSPSSATCTPGGTYGALPTATRTGYTFAGWYTAASGGTQVTSSSTVPSGDHTLYAHWTINRHTLTLNKGTGISGVSGGGTKDYNASVSASATVSTGYHWVNWTGTYASASNPYSFNMPDQSVTLTANAAPNTYTVSFDSRGGSAVAAKTVTYDSTYGTLATPTRPGYTFDGWFTAASGGTQRTSATTVKITSNETLYAHWHPTEYTITRTNKMGSDMDEAPIKYTIESAPITIPNPSWAGHVFVGWTLGMSASGTSSKVPNVNIDYGAGQELVIETGTYGNVSLTAQWFASEYTVTYDGNGANNELDVFPPQQSCRYGEAFTIAWPTKTGAQADPDRLVRKGYEFTGWNTSAKGTGTSYAPGASVKNLPAASGGTVTLFAQWEAIPYHVTFYSNYPGSTYAPITQAFTYDVGQTLRTNTFNRVGHTFAGWYVSKSGPSSIVEGDDLPVLYDRQFVTLSDLDEYLTGTSATELHLFAKWSANQYKVTLLAPDAIDVTQQTVDATYGAHMPPVSIPHRTGYVFQGYYTDADQTRGERYYDKSGSSVRLWDIPANATLYAHWAIVNYTVRYVPGDGVVDGYGQPASPIEEGQAYGRAFSLPSAHDRLGFVRPGYRCAGWRQIVDVNGNSHTYLETQSVSNLTDVDGDIVDLYAVWEPIEYQLVLDAQDGAFNAFEINNSNVWRATDSTYTSVYRTIKYDEAYAFDVEPTRRGYDFAGWFTKPQSTDPDDGGTRVNAYDAFRQEGNQTLYAHWTQKTYYLTLSTAYNQTVLLERIPLLYEETFKLPGDEDGQPPYVFQGEYATPASRNTYLSQYRDPNMTILGWSRDASGTSSNYYTRCTEVSGLADGGEVTLYLTQGPGTYFVRYDANKGEGPEDHVQAIRSGQEVALRPSENLFSRKGHALAGWSPYPDATTPMYKRGDVVEDLADTDRTYILYAVWTPITYRLILDNGRHGQLTKDIVFGQQYIGAPVPDPDDITDGTTFEGYYNFLFGDKMLFDRDGNINTQMEEIANGWNYTGESYIDDSGNTISNRTDTTITLYGRFVTPVEFAYPYGGDDVRYTSAKYIVGIPYDSPVNSSVNDCVGLPTPIYGGMRQDASLEGIDEQGARRTFAGWYTKDAGGALVTDATAATGPVRVDGKWQTLRLYACWNVDVAFEMPSEPGYIDPWRISGGAGWDADASALSAIQGQPYSNASVGGLPSGYRVDYASGYRLVGFNEQGTRVYGMDGRDVWTDASGNPVALGDAQLDGLTLPEGHVAQGDVVTSRYAYALYPEYALNDVDVTIEVYEQGIRKGDALDAEGYSLAHSYAERRRTESALDAKAIIDALGNRTGFDYLCAVISHGEAGPSGIEDADSCDGEQIGMGTSASGMPYDGRVAGDARTVLRIYYVRHSFELSLHDFMIHVDDPDIQSHYPDDETFVRGVARAYGAATDAVRAESPSASLSPFDFGNGDADTVEVYFGEEVTLEAKGADGYAFERWDASGPDADVDHASCIQGPGAQATLTMPDGALDVTPLFEAQGAPFSVRGLFQRMEGATEAMEGPDAYVHDEERFADMEGLIGTVDSLTKVYASKDDAIAAGEADVFDPNDPDDVPAAGKAYVAREVEGFTISRIEVVPVAADGTAEARVYYDRNAYDVCVKWKDVVDAVGFDTQGDVALIDVTDGEGAGTEIEPASMGDAGIYTYTLLYEAQVRLRASAGRWFELTGYDAIPLVVDSPVASGLPDGAQAGAEAQAEAVDPEARVVWEGDWSLLSDMDGNGELDPDTVDADTDGLPGYVAADDASSPHTFEARSVPASDVLLELRAQPLRATYVSRYLFQDADPESETEAASTHTLNRPSEMDGDASYEIEVTRTSDDSRYLRYWIDGTDAENHALDGTDASSDAASRDEGLEIPPTGFEPSDATDATTALSRLTPEGNEVVDGKPMSVTYSKYDRKRHDVTYTYAGGPNESANQRPDGTPAPETVNSYYGATVRIADTPSVNGYGFDGWTWQADPNAGRDDFPYVGQGTDSPSVTVPDADVAITGTWTPREYALSFDGGTAYEESPATNLPDGMTIPFDSEWTVPNAIPTRPGYTFIGWTFADGAWDARLGDQPEMEQPELDAYIHDLKGASYFGGVPLIVLAGETQGPWGYFQEDARTLHAVWMRNSYALDIELSGGTWPTGTDVPLDRYMTGNEIPIPAPSYAGHRFAGWEAQCAGTGTQDALDAISFGTDATGASDPTRATVNKWTWGDVKLVAKWDVLRFDVALNAQGGTFDGSYTGTEDGDVTATYPEGSAPYATSVLSIPYGREIGIDTQLPHPTRPGYAFAGWIDQNGQHVGYAIDGNGDKIEHPYTFAPSTDTVWIATWTGNAYAIEYVWGDDSPENASIDATLFESTRGYAHASFAADMKDADGAPVTSFDLPNASEIDFADDAYSFEGWYTTPSFEFASAIQSFDPAEMAARLAQGNAEGLTLYAKFSKGTIPFKERYWLEVLDYAYLGIDDEWIADDTSQKTVDGKTYMAANGHVYVCDETLALDRTGERYQGVTAQGAAPTGYEIVDPDTGAYRTDLPFSVLLANASAEYAVNGYYNLKYNLVRIGDLPEGASEVHVTSSSGATLLWDTGKDGWLNAEGVPWQEGDGERFVNVPYGADVKIECVMDAGYGFVSWVPGTQIPSDLDVLGNPTSFKMPSYGIEVTPYASPMTYKAFYRDFDGSILAGIAQDTFTVKDGFALVNLDKDARHGYTFDGWVAYVADDEGGRLDTETNPVPETVGYDDSHQYMRVRPGTTSNLLFEAIYVANAYTVTIEVPAQAVRDSSGYPVGLERDDRLGWSVDAETGDVSFTYTPDTLGPTDEPIEIDLSTIKVHPYKVEGWKAEADASNSDEDAPPTLTGATIALKAGDTGSTTVKPTGVIPITFEVVIDPNQEGCIPEGYEIDKEKLKEDMDRLIEEIEGSDSPSKPVITENEDGSWTIEFDVTSEPQVTLPRPVLVPTDPDDPNTPEGKYDFLGWADNEDGTNPTLDYTLPSGNLDDFEEGVPVRPKPVWTPSGEEAGKASIHVYLPDNERIYHVGDAASEWTFAFSGAPLAETKDAYAADEGFAAKCTSTDGYHLGYHLEWYGDFDEDAGTPTGDKLASLPANFPETGDIHIWGVWVQDDDIKPVGFNNVSFGTSGPPGFSGGRSRQAYAFARAAYANVTYYYKPSIGLVVKDEANDTFVKVEYIDESIMSAVDQYLDAGWLFDGYYLEGDDAKEVIIASDGKVDQELLRQKTEGRDIDLTFSDSWTRKQLVRIDLVGGTADKAKVDATLYWWPDLDVFISPSNPAISNEDRKQGIGNTLDTRTTLLELADQGLTRPDDREGEDGEMDGFLGYFGRDALGMWPRDDEGNHLPAAAYNERFLSIGVSDTHLDTFKDVAGNDVSMPYGYDANNPYDPAAPGFYEIKWEAKWEGDFDAVYFNATVPMSMSFMVRADGTTIGPEAGAYQIRNYSNTAISVEDVSFEWAEESELEALFGKGATDALALSATPTDGQEGYAQTKVLLERANATQDAVGAGLVSRYVFGADKWVIAKSIGVDPGDFTGDATALPALKLDYDLTSGGIRQLTQENASQDTTHPIGTLKFTLKTVR